MAAVGAQIFDGYAESISRAERLNGAFITMSRDIQ